MSIRLFALALAVLLMPLAPAHAAKTLTSAEVKKFVGSMTDVNALADEMEKEGKQEVMNAKVKPMQGEEFKPYTKAVSVLKQEFPSDYKKLGGIIKSHGFKSQESWAETGNAVMHAHAASQMKASGYSADKARAGIPPEVLAKMPPEAKAQMEASLQMVKAFSDVPAENMAAVAPYAEEIEGFMQD